ncbi:subtilisin-like protease [Dioscorea cayenensis subsp. rotundata]|uniref:Subtilisin-like protease n=1 Tax=Dioscorea cayennensis subsp. rotundata TaxID=55577 RepID=A0AB40B291_DIOCR|nr:subtilisin-like protease [Dioscorea cayenensis subsp. rotundata]
MSPPFHVLLLFIIIFFFSSSSIINCVIHDHDDLLLSIADNRTLFQIYIIHVDPPNDNVELLGEEEQQKWYESFLPNTTLDSGEPRLLYSYRHVISGFAAKLTLEELHEMERMPGFLLALEDKKNTLGTTHAPDFLGLNQWNSLWQSSNEGEGVIIGIADSGIRHTHVSFKDDGTMPDPPLKWRGCCQYVTPNCDPWSPSKCNNKLIGARAVGSIGSPDDEIGHGTHVASTAGGSRVYNAGVLGQAKGVAVGMAPRAHLAMYRICTANKNHEDECTDRDILGGIDQAITDGVDVLSLSIDTPKDYIQDTVVKSTFAGVEKGILASACAGNGGMFPSRLANDVPWILTVGATSMDRVVKATVKLGNGMELEGQSAYQPSSFSSSTMLELIYPGEIVKNDFNKACKSAALNFFDLKGKIVVCEAWVTNDVAKSEAVKKYGGAAMILLSQSWDGFTTFSEAHVIPTAHLNHVDSLKVVSYFRTEANPTATIIFGGTKDGVRRSPAVGSFSSRGPSLRNGGILKPDIIGPGVDILAAWNKQVGPDPFGSDDSAFNFAHGCSMATPMLAGIIALLKSTHPDWSPAMIKSAIMTTAHTTDRTGQPIADEKSNTYDKASFFAMGAGHVDPTRANDPGLVYNTTPEDYIGYLCSLKQLSEFSIGIIIRRRNFHCADYVKIEPEQLNYPSISVSMNNALLKKITRTVINVGESNSVYKVEVDDPEGVSLKVDPESLTFSQMYEEKSFIVSFNAKIPHPFKGEYSEGQLVWKSTSLKEYAVRSPISVQF